MPLLEGVRIGDARYVYSWGNQDEINPDENVCHVSSGDVCHVWGGGPYNAPLFNLPILPEQNGRVKNNWFFEIEVTFCAHWVTWRAGAKREKSIYDEPSSLCIPRQRVVSMMA